MVVIDRFHLDYYPGALSFKTLRPRQDGWHFADDIFKCVFLNEYTWIAINISLKFVPKGPINNIPSLVLIMAWRRPGDKPLSEPMMVSLLMHICITQPQWIKSNITTTYVMIAPPPHCLVYSSGYFSQGLSCIQVKKIVAEFLVKLSIFTW